MPNMGQAREYIDVGQQHPEPLGEFYRHDIGTGRTEVNILLAAQSNCRRFL